MKKLFIPVCALFAMSFTSVPKTEILISDRSEISIKEAIKIDLKEYFKETRKTIEDHINGLSEKQLSFKPAPNRWSVSQCLEHIIKTEKMLFGMTKAALEGDANPERKSEVKMSDEDLIAGITDRSTKAQASESLMPDGTYESPEAALEAFDEQRDEIMDFINDQTEEDLRNHISDSPFGPVDGYQSLLFIAGHTARHTLQIEEVMQAENFPEE